MRFSKQQALVLYKQPYKDKHEFVTMYVHGLGKCSALAYGSRSLKSKYRGILEPLTVVEVSLAETDHYRTVQDAKKLRGFTNVGQHLGATYYAYVLLEMLHHLLREDEDDPELFELVIDVLGCMEQDLKADLATYYFGVQLFSRLGFFPSFRNCSMCSTGMQEQIGHLCHDSHNFVCSTCRHHATQPVEIPFRYIKVLSFLQGHSIEDVVRLKLAPADKQFLESIISAGFSAVTSREMQTAKVLGGFHESPTVSG